jgi:N-acetylglucosaminyldiphosphoundecaprenol N-acetyl-beta-D-mannosaminyltransferase
MNVAGAKHRSSADGQIASRSDRVSLFGIPVQRDTLHEALNRVDNAIRDHNRLHIGVINAAKVVNMTKDPSLRSAVCESDVIYADGMSVVWASRFLGKPLPERIAGIDLMFGMLERGDKQSYRVYCLGARPEVLESVVSTFRHNYPGLTLAGHHDGYFSADEEASIATQIKDTNPDILLVAITSPKKEEFMARWTNFMNVPIVHGVGGSFDVVAGIVQRAPEAWQNLGLEWLYRVKQEPRRLWKRYVITNSRFILLVIKEWFSIRWRSV